MGVRTSIYLSDDLVARWRASRRSMSDVFRAGLDAIDGVAPPLDAATHRRILLEVLSGVSLAASAPQARYDGDMTYEPFEDIP